MAPQRTASKALLKSIRLVVFDFDGVFTDNRVLVHQDGTEAVFCTRADGIGLNALARTGMGILVLSTETNPVVSARTKKLNIECVQGCDDKWPVLRALLEDRGIAPSEVAFVGNDVNDIECLLQVGLGICVADAYPAAKKAAKVVTTALGGHGAVREVCDLFLSVR